MIASDLAAKRAGEREALRSVIQQWNANRLDLFELSEPNEELVFHGVMRFYFHDSGQRIATKCIRVASDATVTAVIETLIEKFRPDMRMLSVPEYALYVTHENRDERRLNPEEKPLLVQLNWHRDDREGRFLLKRIDDKNKTPVMSVEESSFKRKLSKREKKQLKKQEKLKRVKSNGETTTGGSVAEKLYTELPETSFTRSISNPEAVMRRRRQQKLEKKLQQFRSKDGGPDTGGTLKIYGEALCGDVPYKTLLLSVGDTAAHVVREMLAKYGLPLDTAWEYCLVMVNTAEQQDSECVVDDDECPLAILMNHPNTSGSIMFHVRKRPADYHPRKRKKKPQQKWQRGDLDYRYDDGLPFFLELNPDGSDIMSGTAKRHVLHPNVTEVGSERTAGPNLQLFGPNIQPRHCVIAHTDGLVTVTPCSRDADTYVNGQRIYETTILQNGAIVKFGRIHNFRFIDPTGDERGRRQPDHGLDRDGAAPYGNIMYDRRVVRGSTYASHPVPTENLESQAARKREARRRAIARRKAKGYCVQGRMGTPPPVKGRKHEPVQTERYLEEIYDRPLETEAATQTDLFLDRPVTPPYVPAKVGVDQHTQIYQGELFDFDVEVVPILEVLVGKTIEQALLEVLEEDEMAELQAQQRKFLELRAAEKAETQRLQEQERRLVVEKSERMLEHERGLVLQKETEERVAAAMLSQEYISDLLPSVVQGLRDAGFLASEVKAEVDGDFMPWLMEEVKQELAKMVSSRDVLSEIVRDILEARAEEFAQNGGHFAGEVDETTARDKQGEMGE